jgi:hypothetical protein
MRRTHLRRNSHEPTLVPMADMLTNTVGIVIFILIFIVLATGGVGVAKGLPRKLSPEKSFEVEQILRRLEQQLPPVTSDLREIDLQVERLRDRAAKPLNTKNGHAVAGIQGNEL